jgi:hypothetical protein
VAVEVSDAAADLGDLLGLDPAVGRRVEDPGVGQCGGGDRVTDAGVARDTGLAGAMCLVVEIGDARVDGSAVA